MTPIDFILWTLAILIAVAAFVLIVILLNAMVRALLRKRPRSVEKPLIPGHATILQAPVVHESKVRR
ncbi:hypothetical protein SOM10_12105 [Microbacterium sp. CFBP9023]|uniref:hypothetical protein n=1 Tax=Microbacterium sp. CFBP9023 TaxID=3096535 RepID=UPI002A69E513|nr:hypothetical protein [Microbacterium sp. CFBP9023]MDY0984639.1 hypothetical protein [Microbacterium sp. CFBP9023]